MHINVDSIFERERQTDAVVMEILLILQVITGCNGQMDAVRINRHIIWVNYRLLQVDIFHLLFPGFRGRCRK